MNERYPLPEGWRWVKLGEVCSSAEKRDPKTTPDLPFKYVDISSIDNRLKRIVEARTLLGKDAPSRAKQIIKANDILVATTRPNLNAVAFVPKELNNEICSTGFCALRPTEAIEPLFLFLFVQTQYFIETVSGQVKGMLYPAVTDNQIRTVYLPLPPISDQKRIASKLQELLQEVERARTACEKQLETAKTLPAAYLREVFESEEAKKWERKILGDVISFIKNGIVAGQNFDEKGPQVTRIETISNGVVDSEKIGWVNSPLGNFADFKLFKGDILFSHINSVERLGNCAIYEGIPENLYHGMNLLRIKADESILDPYFLLHWLRSNPCKDYYITNARRAIGQASLNQKDIKQIPIRLPILSIQQRICAELKEKMAQGENLQSSIQNQQSALNALPQTILKKAFSGKL